MKTYRIFFLGFVFMPFMAFAVKCHLPYFTGVGTFDYHNFSADSVDLLYGFYFSSDLGIFFKGQNMVSPSFSVGASSQASLLNSQIATNANSYVSSPFDFPDSRLPSVYYACASLYLSGYNGVGLKAVFKSSSNTYININLRDSMIDILSSTNTIYHQVLFSSLSGISHSISNLYTSLVNINSDVSFLQSDFRAVNTPVFDFSSYLDFLVENNEISPSNQSYFQQTYDSLSSSADRANFAYSVQRSIDNKANTLENINTLSSAPTELANIGNNFNGSVEGAVQDFKRLSTNWQEGVKRDLQDWRSDVTNRLSHMFDDNIPIDGGNSKPVYVSGANGGAVQISGVVGLANDVTVGVSIQDPVQIDSTSFADTYVKLDSLKTSIDTFKDTFFDWAYDGNKYGNWYSFYRLFSDFQNQSLTNQLSLISRFNFTNILENIYAAITNQNTNVVLSAALLDDYQNFVDTSKFSSIVSSLPDNLRDSLSRFGLLDSSDYSGRWWVFQAANMALQSQLALTNAALSSLLSSSLQSLDDYFSDDDDSSSGLLSKWLKLVDDLPEPEELRQTISEATNIVSNVGLERVTVLYDRATNDFSSVVSSVYSDRSLPSSLSFVLIPARSGSPARVVDIPVSDRSSLWSFIRQGMAFGLSVVTLILFPKYLLWLLSHYTRLLEKIIKSLHAYTEH